MPRSRLVFVASVCCAVLAGCGSAGDADSDAVEGGAAPSPSATTTSALDGLTAAKIAERATKATEDAASVRLQSVLVVDGDTFRQTASIDRKGHCVVRSSVPGVGKTVVLRSGKTTLVRLGGQAYLDVSKGRQGKQFRAMCRIGYYTSDLTGDASLLTFAKHGTATVGGKRAVVLDAEGESRSRWYVAAEGEPYLLKIRTLAETDSGTLTFTRYGAPVTVELPPKREWVVAPK